MTMKLLGSLTLLWLAALVKGQGNSSMDVSGSGSASGSGDESGDDMTDQDTTSGLVDGTPA